MVKEECVCLLVYFNQKELSPQFKYEFPENRIVTVLPKTTVKSTYLWLKYKITFNTVQYSNVKTISETE